MSTMLSTSSAGRKQVMPAHPDMGAWGFRVALVMLTLVWAVGALWRSELAQWSASALHATTASGAPEPSLRAVAGLVNSIVRPGTPLVWAPMITLSILLLETGMGAFIIARIPAIVTSGVRLSYRVRVLNPINRGGTPEINTAELWAALLTSLTNLGSDRVALTMSRSANVPATLGVQLRGLRPMPEAASGQASLRALIQTWPSYAIKDRRVGRGAVLPAPHPDAARAESEDVATARRIIEGVLRRADPTAQLEPWPDPLHDARPGMVIVSQELTLAASPHWPLRVPERDDGGVLRGMARALAVPAGIVALEYQVIPAPAQDRGSRRWYARARWWLARMRRRDPLGAGLRPTEEMASLTRKMGEAHAVVTLRLVAIAESNDFAHLAAAHTSLDVMRAALGSMESIQKLPLSTVRQRWVPITKAPIVHSIHYSEPTFPVALHWLHTVAQIIGGVTLGLILTLAATYTSFWRAWGDIPAPARGGILLTWGVSVALNATVTAWRLHCIQPWVILRRVGRRRASSDPVIPFSELWRQPAILGAAEVGQLWRPPEEQASSEVSWTPNRFLPAPASAFVPAGTDEVDANGTLKHPQWLTLGHAFDSGGQLRPVGVPLRALHQMMHITAGMGAGKTQAAAAMCAQLIPWGFIILDGKGDDEGGSLASTVRMLLPPEEEHRLRYLNVLETGFPIALNPIYHYMKAMEQAKGKAERDLYFNSALGLILGLFERLDPGRWSESPGMQQYALMGSHLVLRTGSSRPGEIPTMAKVSRALEDEKYRKSLIARYPFKNDLVYRFWTEREEQLSEAQKTSLHALLRRLDLFMANPITRPMLTGERPSVDLLQAMNTGQIVIIPMPHRNLGGLGPLVGMLILQSIVAAAYAREGNAMSRETAPVFIDEVQVFVVNEQSPDLEQAFTQLRGFAVPLLVLHQTLDQLGALESTFCINAANRLILRTGEPDAATYAKMYSQFGITGEDIKGMEALHHQYAVTLGPNREQLVFSLRPNPWPIPPSRELPPHLGSRSWQTVTAPPMQGWSPTQASGYHELERTLAELIYAEVGPEDFDRITGQLAQLPDVFWDNLLELWDRLRAYHYAYLLEHPSVEPEQMQRQAWLSKLVSSRGAIIEEAIILRQEIRMIRATDAALNAKAPKVGELVVPPRDLQPAEPGSAVVPPALPRPGVTSEEVTRARALRPEDKPDIVRGLDDNKGA